MWEFLKLVISLLQDMDKRVLVAWLSVNRIFLSLWMVSYLIWSSIPIVFHQEWQSVTLFKLWLLRWQHWKVDLKKMLHLSEHLTWSKKLNKSINLATKSTVMKLCLTHTAVKNYKIRSSLVLFIIKDWDIWLMTKCMQDLEVLLLPSPDNPLMVEVVQEVSDLVRWKEIALFLMV